MSGRSTGGRRTKAERRARKDRAREHAHTQTERVAQAERGIHRRLCHWMAQPPRAEDTAARAAFLALAEEVVNAQEPLPWPVSGAYRAAVNAVSGILLEEQALLRRHLLTGDPVEDALWFVRHRRVVFLSHPTACLNACYSTTTVAVVTPLLGIDNPQAQPSAVTDLRVLLPLCQACASAATPILRRDSAHTWPFLRTRDGADAPDFSGVLARAQPMGAFIADAARDGRGRRSGP